MIKLAPSLLAADFANMTEGVRLAEEVGADYLHLDVMDGTFVPNITFGHAMVEAVRRITRTPLDVHLMVERPSRHIERFAMAGADIITFHVEAEPHIQRTLQAIHDFGKKAGVVFNPATPIDCLQYILEDLDIILLMSVNPGYGGQSFLSSSLLKIGQVRKIVEESRRDIEIEVDGGVAPDTARQVIQAGADVLVAGSAIFSAADPKRAAREIREGVL